MAISGVLRSNGFNVHLTAMFDPRKWKYKGKTNLNFKINIEVQ
jgi:hypothetical protein